MRFSLLPLWFVFAVVTSASAQTPAPAVPNEPDEPPTVFSHAENSRVWVSGQLNVIFQTHPAFPAVYSGPNSFRSASEHATSLVATLFTGISLTRHTEVLVDVESAGGRGISDAFGLAGFTDLDVVRNPTLGAAPYLARAMVHYTKAVGGGAVRQERSPLALATTVPARRVELRVGKFGTADFFDINAVGSDSHLQFMNWTVDNNGAYDYAADTRGYTWGLIVEYHEREWTVRFGEMLMPKVANGIDLDWHLNRARAENVEVEWHADVRRRPTTVRLLSYVNHANMGDYREAVQRFEERLDDVPTIEHTRVQGRIKYGVGGNAEQTVTPSLRAFARVGWNEPHAESYAYTEVNSSLAVGADHAGPRWHRPLDKIGGAVVSNGISSDHQEYLRLGGQGFLLGDGSLRYGREDIAEAYYTMHLWRGVFTSLDVQRIVHPGYNIDRGPVLVGAARLHLDF